MDRTDYRAYQAFASWLRQRRLDTQHHRFSVTIVDLSGQPVSRLMTWAHAWRRTLDQDLVLNVYGFCRSDEIRQFQGVRELAGIPEFSGVHRLERAQDGMVITITIGKAGEDLATLASQIYVRADVMLIHGLRSECSASEVRLVPQLLRDDGLLLDLDDNHVHAASDVNLAAGTTGRVSGSSRWLSGEELRSGASVAVVGAGIAGMTMAAELTRRGYAVTVLDEADPLGNQGVHEGHLAAALTPVVSADDNIRSRLSRAGALIADRLWRSLPEEIGHKCGALQVQKTADARRQVDLTEVAARFGMPGWARWVDAAEASEIAGLQLNRGGLWMPGGWVIRVPVLLRVLAETAGLRVCPGRVDRLQRGAGSWFLLDDQGEELARADAVVLTNAGDTSSILVRSDIDLTGTREDPAFKRLQGMHRLAGEITLIPAQALDRRPRCIVGGDGYVLPEIAGWCVAGGTYVRAADKAEVTADGQAENIRRAANLLNLAQLPTQIHSMSSELPGWAGWRAVVPGRLPVVGPVSGQPDLFVCTAGASRGLSWSVLQACLIADLMQARAPALERALLSNIVSGFL